MSKNDNLYKFAKYELDLLLKKEAEENKKESAESLEHEKKIFGGQTMQESMNNDILKLIEALPDGHSGFSMGYLLSCFTKLVKFKNLSPLTLSDDEFVEVAKESDGSPIYQNIRNSEVFKTKAEGIYHLRGQKALDEACGKEPEISHKKVLLTKEEFVNYMDSLETLYRATEKLNEALVNYDSTSDFCGFTNFRAFELIESLLAKLMNDIEDDYGYTTISYYIDELNFGKNYSDGCFTEKDGTPIDISTHEKLYDYLLLDNV